MVIGLTYSPKVEVGSPVGDLFHPGKRYVLLHIGYSHYDGASVFKFQEMGESEPRMWWWFDEEPDGWCDAIWAEVVSGPRAGEVRTRSTLVNWWCRLRSYVAE